MKKLFYCIILLLASLACNRPQDRGARNRVASFLQEQYPMVRSRVLPYQKNVKYWYGYDFNEPLSYVACPMIRKTFPNVRIFKTNLVSSDYRGLMCQVYIAVNSSSSLPPALVLDPMTWQVPFSFNRVFDAAILNSRHEAESLSEEIASLVILARGGTCKQAAKWYEGNAEENNCHIRIIELVQDGGRVQSELQIVFRSNWEYVATCSGQPPLQHDT